MLTTKLIEKIMADVQECASRRSGLLLGQFEMVYPQSQNRSLVRRAILNTLGDSGLLAEIRSVLISHSVTNGDKEEINNDLV